MGKAGSRSLKNITLKSGVTFWPKATT